MRKEMNRGTIRKIVFGFVVLVLIAGLNACKNKRLMVKKEIKHEINAGLIRNIMEQELEYNSIEIKYSTRAELSGNNYALNVTYRNQKNEILWVSVRAMLGIEVLRLVAKRDSVWIISKLGKIKEKGSWKEMSKTIGYPLDFMALQNTMTRKLFYPGREDNAVLQSFLKRDDGSTILLVADFENDIHRRDVGSFGFLPQFILDKKRNQLLGTKLVPEDNEWMVNVKYQEGSNENLGLGKRMLIRMLDSQSDLELDLKIQQVTINEVTKFPFQWF